MFTLQDTTLKVTVSHGKCILIYPQNETTKTDSISHSDENDNKSNKRDREDSSLETTDNVWVNLDHNTD